MEESETSSKIEKDVPRDGCVGSVLKEKTHIWNNSCKESIKRETKLYKIVEIAANDEKQQDKERNRLKNTLQKLQKEREEENETRAVLEEIQ